MRVLEPEEAATALLELAEAFRYTADRALEELVREELLLERDAMLSDALYATFVQTSRWRREWAYLRCKHWDHDWQDVPEPITIRRWCDRCYKVEDMPW